jgi:peptidoglycan hydrolase-like protein with peptidoglycan-binding domain
MMGSRDAGKIALARCLAILTAYYLGRGMNTRLAAIVIGLLAAGALTLALDSAFSQSFAAPNKPPKAAAHLQKKPETHQAAADQTGSLRHRKSEPREKAAPVAATYATIPAAERLAVQADLAWLGHYEGAPGGDYDQRTVEAIKAFQKITGNKETGVLNEQERARLAAAAHGPQEADGWKIVDDPATGARLGIPTQLVSPAGVSRTGSRWASGHDQIRIETFRLSEASLTALFDEEKKTTRQRHADSSALKPDSFVISGTQGLKNFIVRAETSGGEVRGITILYDQATAGIVMPVAIAMGDSFVGFPDPKAGPPPGRKRAVEYSTAIVADRDGDLVASARVTAECESLTVPGFGHAARVAEDSANDLALMRLYGAHNLAPAPMAGTSQGQALTLVGVADPLAQEGGGAMTSVSARLSGQTVEPVPKPGFSGAAAVDAQGHFAGMVALSSPVVAGSGPATPQAMLVPADTVRTFLMSHGIAPAGGHGGIDQSVLRVICVRK